MSMRQSFDRASPKFSVIIPVYNSAETLQKAIESVLEQTWPAHEVIVVDDGSTDSSLQVANGFASKVRVIHQSNAGVAAARNLGAESATGDWLAFLDADDWYYPDRLRWHAEWIGRDAGLDFLTGDYEYRREDGSLISTSMGLHPSGREMLAKAGGSDEVVMELQEIESFVADHFGDIHTLSIPGKTFHELGGFPPGFKVCEDVHFLTRLCAVSSRVGVICRPMGAYLIHDASATRADPLRAQEYNVQTLLDLKYLARGFSAPVQRGVMARLRNGRLNLGYALVKSGRRRDALGAVLPSLVESPGWDSLRNVVSILRG
jgi:GT2 family glycosyltransferase